MTDQEAAEELLRGPYEPCPVCAIEGAPVPPNGRCGKCDNMRRQLRENYRTACRVIEIIPTPLAEDIILKGDFWHGSGSNLEYEKAAAVLDLPPVPMEDPGQQSATTRDVQYSEDNRCMVYMLRAAREAL